MSTTIISGGQGGIGAATATRLARDGYTIGLLVRTESKTVTEFLQTLPGSGHFYCICDVSKEEDVIRSIETILGKTKTIDVLIHTAVEPIIRKSALHITSQEFRKQFEVDTFGGFNLFSHIGNIMKKQNHGSIIGVLTVAIEENGNGGNMVGYVSSKFALKGLLRELSKELSKNNVRVNAVSPGFVPTKLNADLPERIIDFVKEASPIKQVTSAEDVANVISEICSEKTLETGMSFPVLYGEITKL